MKNTIITMTGTYKNIENICIGDLIFGKVKGHPPWPAKVLDIITSTKQSNRYEILFFTTNESAKVRATDVVIYNTESKLKYNIDKIAKTHKEKYSQALIEIDNAWKRLSKENVGTVNSINTPKNISNKTPTNKRNSFNGFLIKNNSTPKNNSHNFKRFCINTGSQTDCCLYSKSDKSTSTDISQIDMELLSVLESKTITDDIIQLYYGILENRFLTDSTHLLNPAIAQAIKCLEGESLYDIIAPLNLNDKSFIIIPVCDAPGIMVEAGTHWSLILFVRELQSFFYFDSIGMSNFQAAEKIVRKVSNYLRLPTTSNSIITVKTPQQNNTVDCAIYVILITDLIVKKIIDSDILDCKGDLNIELPLFGEHEILMKRAQLVLLLHKRQNLNYTKQVLGSIIFHIKNTNDGVEFSGKNKELEIKSLQNENRKLKQEVMMLKTKLSLYKYKENAYRPITSVKNRGTKEVNMSKEVVNNIDGWVIPKHTYRKNNMPIKQKEFTLNTYNRYKPLYQELNLHEDSQQTTRAVETRQNHKSRSSLRTKSKPAFGRKIKLLMYSDSQGRDVWQHLKEINNSELNTLATVLPNAPLLQVVETALQSITDKGDVAVLLGGTNDTIQGNLSGIYKNLENKLSALNKKMPVLISTIPHRFDRHNLDPVHKEIGLLNNYIREMVIRTEHTHLVDLDELKRYHFTRQGLHLNQKGKKKFAYLVVQTLQNMFSKSIVKENINVTNQSIKLTTRNKHIQIADCDMKFMIEELGTERDVAFVHCISADFDNVKHMSAGVAVTFREEFGRPLVSDYIASHLTLQKSSHGASVFSLVTKPKYYAKPRLHDYDTAFDQLIEHFKINGFKKLICSPLGCVRDRINTLHFANRISELQYTTGASIEVVLCNEHSVKELLRNGLSHKDFQHRLIEDISQCHLSQKNSLTSSRDSNHDTQELLSESMNVDELQEDQQPTSQFKQTLIYPRQNDRIVTKNGNSLNSSRLGTENRLDI